MRRSQNLTEREIASLARESFERKFGDDAGIWLDGYVLKGAWLIIYYGYSEEKIASFQIRIPRT